MSNPYRLEEANNRKKCQFTFNGQILEGYEGEPIAAALLANGIKSFRNCTRKEQNRGVYCGIGHCFECRAIVDDISNVRTCLTPLEEGVQIKSMEN